MWKRIDVKYIANAFFIGNLAGYDSSASQEDKTAFQDWLQCYGKAKMKRMKDHNGRMIWFCGKAGPMIPKR